MSFDIKFIRQGFDNACRIWRLCQAIIHHVIEAEPDKLDIKRRDPGILFISYPLVHYLIANLVAGIDFPN